MIAERIKKIGDSFKLEPSPIIPPLAPPKRNMRNDLDMAMHGGFFLFARKAQVIKAVHTVYTNTLTRSKTSMTLAD